MGQQSLATGLQREHVGACQWLRVFFKWLESELNFFDCLVFQYRLDFIGGTPNFWALGHGDVHLVAETPPLFHRFNGGGALVREASGPILFGWVYCRNRFVFVTVLSVFATLGVIHIPLCVAYADNG